MTSTTLHIPEMDCPGEGVPIEKALRSVPGVRSVKLDYDARRATVEHEDASAEVLVAAVEALSFSASAVVPRVTRLRLAVDELCCEVEGADIRRRLEPMGFSKVSADPMTRSVLIECPEDGEGPGIDAGAVVKLLEEAGYHARPFVRRTHEERHEAELPWMRLSAALVVAIAAEAADLWIEYRPETLPVGHATAEAVMIALALVAILLAGLTTVKRGFKALFSLNLNMNALMAVAVTGGVLIGAYPEAAMVMVLFEISETIEALSMAKARRSIRDLMSVAPEKALVVKAGGETETVPVDVVAPGVVVRVGPGDRVPLDGRILRGSTSLDQSMVTGEGLPAEKAPGETVWAGTVNLTATIDVEVTAPASDSLTSRIIEAVENAQAAKSPVQRFVDRFALVYTPCVFAVAVGVALVPPLFTGDWLDWIYKGLVILVIACPCALVISTPVTLVSALATATRCGLLVKGGLYLEQARHLKNVALDKTGTLTRGEPEVTDVHASDPASIEKTEALAASLAAMNKHPLSEAISRRAAAMDVRTLPVESFKAIPGAGVEGRVGGALVRLVNRRWLESHGLLDDGTAAAFDRFAAEGASSVALADFFGVRAVYGFADQIKEDAVEGLRQLEAVGLTPRLLTGDTKASALKLARTVGLEHVDAELLPEDKLRHIEEMQKTGLTAMVGDGINDAPALARADIGVAMGVRGADSAIEAAHVAVMDDKIGALATLVRLSRITHRILVENIAFALGVKFLFVVLALSGWATMWMAVFADTGTCLLVVANGMRMLRMKPRLDAEAEAVARSTAAKA